MAHETAPAAAKDQPTGFPCEACGSPDGMANEIKGVHGRYHPFAKCRDCGHEISHWLANTLETTPMAPDAARILEWLDGWSDTEGYAREAAAIIREQGAVNARLRGLLDGCRAEADLTGVEEEYDRGVVSIAACELIVTWIDAALSKPDPPDAGVTNTYDARETPCNVGTRDDGRERGHG